MTRAWGLLAASASCYVIGAITIIGIPIFWPIGFICWIAARRKEKEMNKED